MSKEDILRTNIEYYWKRLSEIEKQWLQDHVVLEQNRVIIYKDRSYKDWEDFINRLSAKIGFY